MKQIKSNIITMHSAHNYGAMLQVYALQESLKKLGCKVKVIDYEPDFVMNQYKLVRTDNFIACLKSIIRIIILNKTIIRRYFQFEKFKKNYLSLTEDRYKDFSDLNKIESRDEVYICGSDQIWNPDLVGGVDHGFLLDFVKEGNKKISYAASIGKNCINQKYEASYINSITNFDRVSVREKIAQSYLKNKIDKDIDVVCDPTLLLKREEWENLIKDSECKYEKEKYLLVYMLGENSDFYRIATHLSKKLGLKIIYFSRKNYLENTIGSAFDEGPLQFIKYIKNADFVLTSSFHGTIFSLIFNKRFLAVSPKGLSSRIYNILEQVGLSEKLVETFQDYLTVDIDNYSFDAVNRRIMLLRNESLSLLKEYISN